MGPLFAETFPIALAALMLMFLSSSRTRGEENPAGYPGVILLGIAGQLIVQLFITRRVRFAPASDAALLTRLEATQAALSNYLIPLFGVLIAALVLQKQLTGFIIVGGLLALATTLLITVWDHTSQPESLGSLGDQTSLPSNRS
jgi:drug/metabolite transporter (DMT)-like permease